MKTQLRFVGWVLLGANIATLLVLAAVGLRTHMFYAIQTGSMNPTIPPKSLVVVDPGKYHVGQPIAFRKKGGIVTHRLVKINPDGTLVSKGDANRTPDASSIKPEDVIGGVIAAPKYLGYWLTYLKNPIGFASIVVDVLLIFQLSALFSDESDSPKLNPKPKTALQPA